MLLLFAALYRIARRWWNARAAGTAIGALLLAFRMLQMFSVSFGIPYAAAGGPYSRRFNRVAWLHDES